METADGNSGWKEEEGSTNCLAQNGDAPKDLSTKDVDRRNRRDPKRSILCPYAVFATAGILVLTIVLITTHFDRLLPDFKG